LKKVKFIGLIGYPLSHSFSQGYFTDKFKNEGIEGYQYLNFEIENIDRIRDVILNNPDLIGLNVTIPYKESIKPYLHGLSADAEKIGAVNTIVIDHLSDEAILTGHNTDHIGFSKTLELILEKNPSGAMILGTGGASKAVEYSLNKRNIPHCYISRNPTADAHSYNEIDRELLDAFPVIINTTPLGMYPDIDNKPDIPYDLLNQDNYLIDLIYNPEKTLFLKLGEKAGAKIINGLPMLIAQAEAAWELWHAKA
jgi:shikimate dehydrogenase